MLAAMNLLAVTIDWQNAAAGLIALAAAGYLGRRMWMSVRSRRLGGCGACATCPAEGSSDGRPLVTLESVTASARRDPSDTPA
jgi:hypothetical protein